MDQNSIHVQIECTNRERKRECHKREWRVGEQLSHSQGYVWSAAPMNSFLYRCEPETISTTVWEGVFKVKRPAMLLGKNAKCWFG